jgi:hypothetical protein
MERSRHNRMMADPTDFESAAGSKEMQGITTFGIALSSTNLDRCQTTAGKMVRVLDDCAQIALGPGAVKYDANRALFRGGPVHGIFDGGNSHPSAIRARQRIHGIGIFCGRNIGSPDVLSTRVSVYQAPVFDHKPAGVGFDRQSS